VLCFLCGTDWTRKYGYNRQYLDELRLQRVTRPTVLLACILLNRRQIWAETRDGAVAQGWVPRHKHRTPFVTLLPQHCTPNKHKQDCSQFPSIIVLCKSSYTTANTSDFGDICGRNDAAVCLYCPSCCQVKHADWRLRPQHPKYFTCYVMNLNKRSIQRIHDPCSLAEHNQLPTICFHSYCNADYKWPLWRHSTQSTVFAQFACHCSTTRLAVRPPVSSAVHLSRLFQRYARDMSLRNFEPAVLLLQPGTGQCPVTLHYVIMERKWKQMDLLGV
jgi:hypothetical protein